MERSLSISSGEISKKAPRTGTGLLSVAFSHCFCGLFGKNQLSEGLRCLICIFGGCCHKYHFCRDKSFVSTNTCLTRQNTSFVATKVCLPRQNVCRVKILFVATKDRYLSRQKTCFVATNKRVCRDTIMFVATNVAAGPANDGFQLQCTYLGAKGAEQVACVLDLFGAERCILRDFVFSLFLSFTYSRELISQSVLSDCRGRNFRVGIFVWQSRSEVRNRFINL